MLNARSLRIPVGPKSHGDVSPRMWYHSSLMTSDTYAKEIRIFGLGRRFSAVYDELRRKLRSARMQLELRHLASESGPKAGATIALFGSYALIAWKASHGAITIGDVIMLFGAFQRGLITLQSLLKAVSGLYEDNLFLSNLCQFLEIKPTTVSPKHPRAFPRPMSEGITLRDVSFSYPNSDRLAVNNVSLRVAPEEIVALVGENNPGNLL